MILNTPDIRLLPTTPEQIDAAQCLPYLQRIKSMPSDKAEATHLLEHIAAIIRKETGYGVDTGNENNENANFGAAPNQIVLNLAFRFYYQLLHKQQLQDTHFGDLPNQLTHTKEISFLCLHSILLTEHWRHLDASLLESKCVQALRDGIAMNSSSLLAILRALNMLIKRYPILDCKYIELEHFHHCMQCAPVGMREETLILFNYCCQHDAQRAFEYFQLLIEFWPWTNRNKYYLLSGILNAHKLEDLIQCTQHTMDEFMGGLRRSLSYKSLLAASQYLIKSLSQQESQQLLQLCVVILSSGSLPELQNFHAQWFARIKQQDALFALLQTQPDVVALLENTNVADSDTQYRCVIVFSMFSKQLFSLSKLHFFKISTELLTNCYSYTLDAQLLIFRFLVDNLANFAIEDCLDFLYSFMRQHRSVESAQFRNTMIGKLPNIINHISKHFNKTQHQKQDSTLASSIRQYFIQLQQLIERDLHDEAYQPQIFALKLFEILYGSLYATKVSKNAKNCSMQQNKQLGSYLREQNVFDEQEMSNNLLKLLYDAQGFDDAQDLAVKLIQQLNCLTQEQSMQLVQDYCTRSDVDECVLVTLHARVAISMHKSEAEALEMYENAWRSIEANIHNFKQDPLLTTKGGKHLFGFLNVINEVAKTKQTLFEPTKVKEIIKLLHQLLNMLLDMLNLANIRSGRTNSAADFQDMDESLQLLVEESSYERKSDNAEDCRKYLLMSFWLTLKATCDLATSLGCLLVNQQHSTDDLKQCFYINVAVLTRCRHKGAIEAAGVSIGQLTKCITSTLSSEDESFKMLHSCLAEELLVSDRQVSTTRRGAGFAIMFLHIVKNDEPRERPILKRAMSLILQQLKNLQNTEIAPESNHDRLEALTLHYLCVLAKDTELRNAMSKYYNEVLLAAIANIDNAEWTVCNAALQLFGALVPKLVGQRQATEYDVPLNWEPSELSYRELARILPQTCQHILNYCATQRQHSSSTRSIILFLGFLAKVEHLRMRVAEDVEDTEFLQRFRILSWQLLQHECEQVRRLAATCFVRGHEFRCELPEALLSIAKLLAVVRTENFCQGLIYALHDGVLKLQHESQHVWTRLELVNFMQRLTESIKLNDFLKNCTLYTLTKLLDLLKLLQQFNESKAITELVQLNKDREPSALGHALWQKSLDSL